MAVSAGARLDGRPVPRPGRDGPHRVAGWRRPRRVVLLALTFCLIPAAISWLGSLGGPRNVGLGVSTVEWIRANGGNPLVSEVENAYYTLAAPSKGGPTLTSLPRVGVEGSEAQAAAGAYRPAPIKQLIHPALKGEGEWHAAEANAGPGRRSSSPPSAATPNTRSSSPGSLGSTHPDEARLRPRPGRAAGNLEHRGSGEVPPACVIASSPPSTEASRWKPPTRV